VYDAAIVGAGIAGGCMAAVLADFGWDVLLMDQHAFPRHKVCGEFLSPEARTALRSFGLDKLVDSLRPSGMEKVHLTAEDGTVLEIPLPGTALGVSRYALDSALLKVASEKGADVRTNMKVTAVQPVKRGYKLELYHKSRTWTAEARIVIGAWGRSPRLGLTGGRRPDPGMGMIGVKSHYEGIGHEAAVELYFFPGGYLGLSPVEGGRTNVAALLSPEAFHRAGKTAENAIAMAARYNSALGRRLEGGQPVPGTQKAVAPVTLSRKPVAWDVVPHIGDAAAVVAPLCGDGMAMALRSVELCVPWADRFLRGDITQDVWRSQYTRSLRKQFSGPLWWGNLLQHAMAQPLLASALLRFGWRMPGTAAQLVRATRLKE